MTVECVFGIASSKFTILLKSIETKVENADHIVKAICILHNTIIDLKNKNAILTQHNKQSNDIDMTLNDYQILGLKGCTSNNRATRAAIAIRNYFVKNNKI